MSNLTDFYLESSISSRGLNLSQSNLNNCYIPFLSKRRLMLVSHTKINFM